MAENSSVTVGEYRRHPPPLLAEPRVSDRVNTTMNSVKTTGSDTLISRLLGQAGRMKLAVRDDTMLSGGNPSH